MHKAYVISRLRIFHGLHIAKKGLQWHLAVAGSRGRGVATHRAGKIRLGGGRAERDRASRAVFGELRRHATPRRVPRARQARSCHTAGGARIGTGRSQAHESGQLLWAQAEARPREAMEEGSPCVRGTPSSRTARAGALIRLSLLTICSLGRPDVALRRAQT